MDPDPPLRYPARVKPYSIVYKDALPHGIVAGVCLPADGAPPSESDMAALHPDERSAARHHRGFRLSSYVGGRLAAHAAVRALGGPFTGIGTGPRGAPVAPAGIALSITHKRTLAIAVAAKSEHGDLGVDLEDYGPPRPSIEEHILRPEERTELAPLPDDRKWIALVLRFSIKESIYKALDPYVNRYVGFHEAQVRPDLEGGAAVALYLKNGEGPFEVDARYCWLAGRLVTSARIRRAP